MSDKTKIDIVVLEPWPRDQMRLNYFSQARDKEGRSFPQWRITEDHGVIVSLYNGHIVSALGYVFPQGLSRPEELVLEHIYVLPERRREGRGSAMVRSLVLLAQVRSMVRLVATAHLKDEVYQSFLSHAGFTQRSPSRVATFNFRYFLPIGAQHGGERT